MKFDVINGSCLYPDRNRLFPVRYLSDGTPCIIGTPPGEPDEQGTAISVFSAAGGLAPMHPDPETGDVWYEVHLGDFVVVVEYGSDIARIIFYSYQIRFISPSNLAHGVPVGLD